MSTEPTPSPDDSFAAIDTSPLDALQRLRGEIDALDARLATMQSRRDSVAVAVYERVRSDYEQRRRALDADADPLRAQARAAYATLRQQAQQVEAAHAAARLDREEIDFRFSLDEFDADEHRRRVVDIDRRLADHGAARERADALRARFVAAFASQDELEAGLHDDAATVQMRTLDPAMIPPPAPPPSSGDAPTVTLQPLPPQRLDTGATQVMRTLKRDGSAPRSDQTLIMRTARLLPQSPEAGTQPVVIALKPLLLGSGDDCDVRIAAARPHQAEIRASMAGFTITDHGGGVRINGVPIEQHLLRQDDAIDVAGARFVFRET